MAPGFLSAPLLFRTERYQDRAGASIAATAAVAVPTEAASNRLASAAAEMMGNRERCVAASSQRGSGRHPLDRLSALGDPGRLVQGPGISADQDSVVARHESIR